MGKKSCEYAHTHTRTQTERGWERPLGTRVHIKNITLSPFQTKIKLTDCSSRLGACVNIHRLAAEQMTIMHPEEELHLGTELNDDL